MLCNCLAHQTIKVSKYLCVCIFFQPPQFFHTLYSIASLALDMYKIRNNQNFHESYTSCYWVHPIITKSQPFQAIGGVGLASCKGYTLLWIQFTCLSWTEKCPQFEYTTWACKCSMIICKSGDTCNMVSIQEKESPKKIFSIGWFSGTRFTAI